MKRSECEAKIRSLLLEEVEYFALYGTGKATLDFLVSHLADEIASFIYSEWGLEKD